MRKRYLQTGNGGVDRCQIDGTNVVYRKQRRTPYVKCAFLDDGDTIIAANDRSYVDIVRLPQYEGTSAAPTRPLGRALCTDISLKLERTNLLPQCKKIHGFNKGESFAVGLSTGEFQIFSTERTTPVWISKAASFGIQMTYTTPIQDFITFAYKVLAPRRFDDWGCGVSLVDQLLEPRYWMDKSEVNLLARGYDQRPNWDFRENSAGSLQAVNIGIRNDNFSFRIHDSRTPGQDHSSICVDMLMKDYEYMGAICFLNDHSVATLRCNRTKRANAVQCREQVKIWDLRIIRKEERNHLQATIPSFPDIYSNGFGKENCVPMVIDYSCYQALPKYEELSLSELTLLPNGHVVVSSLSHQCHFVIDPVQMTTVSVVHTRDKMDLFAIDRQNGFIATYGSNGHDTGGNLSFFDIHTRPKNAVSSGKKRKIESLDSGDSDLCKKSDFEIPTDVQDRNGLATTLSHMSFNNLGSSLIATSLDGDIFLWRAS